MTDNDRYKDTMKRLKRMGINTDNLVCVIQELTEEIDYYRSKIKDMEQAASNSRIMYVCDRRKCNRCTVDSGFCGFTSDIRHAKNFELCKDFFYESPPI